MTEKFIAIITARGGSKRLPNKNIHDLAGQPLISWTIEAAKNCDLIQEVVVSTDSMEIKEIAEKYNATVPFLRPENLSNDTASSFDVVKHCIDYYKNEENREFEYLILLQPTSPLRTSEDITNAIHLLESKNADAVISICETDHSPLWSNTVDDNLCLDNFLRDEVKNTRSQDLPSYYRINGAIYICKVSEFLKQKTFFLINNIFGYKMSTDTSVDIDTKLDFIVADFLLKEVNSK